jgi:hypothetical protein
MQVLDYVTGILIGAKGFLPNLHAGTAAACLTRLLSKPKPLSEFEWSQALQIAHTLRSRHRNAAKAVSDELTAGRANPADTISKFILAALRITAPPSADAAAAGSGTLEQQQQQQHVIRLVLEEWLASILQRRYGKSAPETDAAYCQSLLQYIPLEALFGAAAAADIDPLQQLHPLEAVRLTSQQQQQQQQCVQLQVGWQGHVLQRLAGSCPGVPAHPVLAPFLQRAGRLLALLLPADASPPAAAASAVGWDGKPDMDGRVDLQQRTAAAAAAAAVAWCWQDWQQGFLELLLLRQRTARYNISNPAAVGAAEGAAAAAAAAAALSGAASQAVGWVPAERASLEVLAVQRLREALAEQLQGFRQARAAEAKRQLVAAAAKQLLAHGGSAEAADEALQRLGQLQLRPKMLAHGICSSLACSDNGVASEAPGAAAGATAAAAGVAGVTKGPAATLLGQTVPLLRSDVPAVLECLGAANAQPAATAAAAAGAVASGIVTNSVTNSKVTPAILHALVLGDWCTQGPQALRRSELVLQLIQRFGEASEALLTAIRSLEECRRSAGFNSRGHSASLRYPGPEDWTSEYAAARLAAVTGAVAQQVRQGKRQKVVRYIKQMQRYAAVAAWAKDAAAAAAAGGGAGGGGDVSKVAAVAGVLAGEMDANRLPAVVARLEAVLGVKVPAAVMTCCDQDEM